MGLVAVVVVVVVASSERCWLRERVLCVSSRRRDSIELRRSSMWSILRSLGGGVVVSLCEGGGGGLGGYKRDPSGLSPVSSHSDVFENNRPTVKKKKTQTHYCVEIKTLCLASLGFWPAPVELQ